jgi:hypothetical protein
MDYYNKIVDNLANIDVKINDEGKILLLLSSLPKSFENFKDVLLYCKEDTITLEEFQSAIKKRKKLTKLKNKMEDSGEGLNAS